MNSPIHKKSLAPSVPAPGEFSELTLSAWIDEQLADLEKRHAEFVTRDSLARHFKPNKSGRRRD